MASEALSGISPDREWFPEARRTPRHSLEPASAGDGRRYPLTISLSLLSDRVRPDVSAPGPNRGVEFWARLCQAPGLGLGLDAQPDRRSGSGVFIELERPRSAVPLPSSGSSGPGTPASCSRAPARRTLS
jgi:hypothetical protein